MTAVTQRPWRRVVVALDPAEQCRAALETAARLAAANQAELVGLFVEESGLLEAAALPVTTLVRGTDSGREPLDPAKMEQGLRAWAARARATLSAAAERWQIKASFQVSRGRVAETLLAEAGQCDLLALGAVSRPTQRLRIGATALRLAREAPCAVMVTRSSALAAAGGPTMGQWRAWDPGVEAIRVLFEGNPAVLALAARLARLDDLVLEVFTTAALVDQAKTRLKELGLRWDLRLIDQDTADAVAQRLTETPARAVVLGRKGTLGSKLETEDLLRGSVASLLLLSEA